MILVEQDVHPMPKLSPKPIYDQDNMRSLRIVALKSPCPGRRRPQCKGTINGCPCFGSTETMTSILRSFRPKPDSPRQTKAYDLKTLHRSSARSSCDSAVLNTIIKSYQQCYNALQWRSERKSIHSVMAVPTWHAWQSASSRL